MAVLRWFGLSDSGVKVTLAIISEPARFMYSIGARSQNYRSSKKIAWCDGMTSKQYCVWQSNWVSQTGGNAGIETSKIIAKTQFF